MCVCSGFGLTIWKTPVRYITACSWPDKESARVCAPNLDKVLFEFEKRLWSTTHSLSSFSRRAYSIQFPLKFNDVIYLGFAYSSPLRY